MKLKRINALSDKENQEDWIPIIATTRHLEVLYV